MAAYSELQGFRINKMTKTIYDELKAQGEIKSNEAYIVLRGNDPTGLPDYDNKSGFVLKVNSEGTDVEWSRDINNAAIFENISAMVDTLNNASKNEYSAGQSIFIADTNVPDFWIYSVEDNYVFGNAPTKYDENFYQFGYFKISLLEIGKVIFNSNITYSETEPNNADIGDIWLAPAQEIINELPPYNSADIGKSLQVSPTGNLHWKKLAPVEANPELDGTEQDLTSVKIDGVLYQLKGQGGEGSVEMIFSDSPKDNGTPLRTITIGDDIWSIPLGSGGSGEIDLTGYATEEYVNSQGFLKQDALSTYAKTTYVDQKVAELVDSAPESLNTLKELSDVLMKNENMITILEDSVISKQDKLVSGTNIKTVNGQSIVGTGNIEINTGSGVIPNPTLIGIEPELDGIGIDGVNYAIPSGLMTLSNEETTEGEPLKTITVGDYIWRIESEKVDLTPYATLQGVNILLSELDERKQNTLTDNDFKTINGTSVFGAGEITLDIPEVDLTGYATETWVEGKGYATNTSVSNALNNYVSKNELPNLDNYITGEYVDNKVESEINKIIGTAPETLNTLGEIAAIVSANDNLLDTLNSAITNKADKSDTVNLSTTQTINGMKTFTSSIVLSYEPLSQLSPVLNFKAENIYGNIGVLRLGTERRLEITNYNPSNVGINSKFILSDTNAKLEYSTDGLTTVTKEFVYKDELKTVNGQSLVGSGNIEIDLSNYYNKTEIDNIIDSKIGAAFDTIDALIGG